jgi:hypothetical protein
MRKVRMCITATGIFMFWSTVTTVTLQPWWNMGLPATAKRVLLATTSFNLPSSAPSGRPATLAQLWTARQHVDTQCSVLLLVCALCVCVLQVRRAAGVKAGRGGRRASGG